MISIIKKNNMIGLKDYILDNIINEGVFDVEANVKKMETWRAFCNEYKTLCDCLNGCIVVTFEKRYGPTHYEGLSELRKRIKKVTNPPTIVNRMGKPVASSILSDVIFGIASRVEVDWSLDPAERIKKAMEDFDEEKAKIFNEIKLDEIQFEKDWGESKTKTRFSVYGLDFARMFGSYSNGRKTIKNAHDEIGYFTFSYGSEQVILQDNGEYKPGKSHDAGDFKIGIKGNSPLMYTEEDFDK